MKITYPSRLAPVEIVGRVLGPDQLGGYVYVTHIERTATQTRATCRPMNPDQFAHVIRDDFGQLWYRGGPDQGSSQ